jgi:hypothetical protein
MSSRGPNNRPRQCVDKVSKVWTEVIRLQEVQIKDQDSVLTHSTLLTVNGDEN